MLCFDAESVRVWRGVSSIEHASIGMEPITTQEAEALSNIGSNAGVISIDEYCHTSRSQRVIMGNIKQQLKKRAEMRKAVKNFQNSINQLVENYTVTEDLVFQIMDILSKHSEADFTNDISHDLEVVRNLLKKDINLEQTEISTEKIIETLVYIIETNSQKKLDNNNTNIRQTVNNVCKKKVDSSTINLIHRWEKRCELLKIIRENDINGFGKTQRVIAKEAKCRIGLTNKISQLYYFDTRISEDDLWENKRGAKPNPFKKIPENIYQDLYNVCSQKTPVEEQLQFHSWSAAAIFYYLRKNGVDVKLSYIYDFCQKLGFTSKFCSRKNPKENPEEIAYFLSVRYPQICKDSVQNNRRLIFLDECHVLISPHFRGYSFVNTESLVSYDTNLDHSMYTILTFIGLDGFIKVYMIKGSMDSGKFTDILEQFKQDTKGENFSLLMDNSKIHTSYESFGWYLDNAKTFTINFLPRYCPRLNVVEFFNNVFKNELKKDSTMSNIEMVDKAKKILQKYNTGAEEIKKDVLSLFQKNECAYITQIYNDAHTVKNESAA